MPDFNFLFKAVAVPDEKSVISAGKEFQKMVSANQEAFSIDLKMNTSNIDSAISNIKKSVGSISGKTFDFGVTSADSIIAKVDEHRARVVQLESEYVNLKAKMYESSKSGEGYADQMKMKMKMLSMEIENTFSDKEIKTFESALGSVNSLSAFGAEQIQDVEYYGNGISDVSRRMIELKGVGETVVRVYQSLDAETGKWTNTNQQTIDKTKALSDKVETLLGKIRSLREAVGGGSSGVDISQLNEIEQSLRNVDIHSESAGTSIKYATESVQRYQDELRGSSGALNQYISLKKTMVNEEIELNKETLKGKSANKEYIETIRAQIKADGEQLQILKSRIKGKENIARMTTENTRLENKQTEAIKRQNEESRKQKSLLGNVASGMKEAAARVTNYTIAYRVLWAAVRAFRESLEIAKELNASFTDIQMVTLGTAESISKLKDEYQKLAIEMSSTVNEVAKGSSEWLRQGKTAEETTSLIRASMVMSRIGAIDSAEATSYLTSTLNGYKMEVEDAMHVVDAMSQVDVESASSVSDLAKSLQKSASTADMAGVSFERLIGYAATIREVTQKSADTIGESLKTIFSRLGSVKAGTFLSEDLESEYTDINTFINDTEKVLSKVGIRVRDTNQDFRDAEDILDDVASAWSKYNDLEKNAISTAIAGTRQRESFISLMSNYDKAITLSTSALNSNGKAMEKYNIYQDSIAASQDRIRAYWESFVNEINLEKIIKDFFKLGEAIMSVISNENIVQWAKATAAVLSFVGVAKLLFTTIQMFGGIKAAGGVAAIVAGAGTGTIGAILAVIGAIISLIAIIDKFHKSSSELRQEIAGLNSELSSMASEIEGYTGQIKANESEIATLQLENATPVTEDRINSLKKENTELERKILRLKEEEEYKRKIAERDAQELYGKSGTTTSYGDKYSAGQSIQYYQRMAMLTKESFDESEFGTQEYEVAKKNMDEYNKKLLEQVNTAELLKSTLDEESDAYKDVVHALDVYYDSIMSTQEKVDKVLGDEANEEIVNKLKDLAYSSEDFASEINNIEFSSVIDKLKSLGFETEDIIELFKQLSYVAGTSSSISLMTYGSMLSKISDKTSKVKAAQAELSKNNVLSAETVKNLTDAGLDLGDSLVLTKNGYSTTQAALEGLLETQKQEYIMAVEKAREAAIAITGYKADERLSYEQTTSAIIAKLTAQIAEMEVAFASKYQPRAETEEYRAYRTSKQTLTNLQNSIANLKTYNETVANIGKVETGKLKEKTSKKDEETAYERDIRNMEHRLFLSEQLSELYDGDETKFKKYSAEREKQSNILLALENRVLAEEKSLRKKGYTDSSKEIQELQSAWWEYHQKRIDMAKTTKEYEEKLAKESLDKLKDAIGDLMEEEKAAMEKQVEYYEYQIEKLSAIKDLTSSYYDVINGVNSELRSINSELEISKQSYKYMDEELRKTLFNEEDYNKLSQKLNKISSESSALYQDYLDQLDSLGEDEIYKAELITDEFERQFNYKKMEYDIAVKEVELIKAQTELQNVMSNRNVRMFTGGEWIWTADREAVKSAQENVDSAKEEIESAKTEMKQQEVLDGYDNLINSNKLLSETAKAEYERLSLAWEETQKLLDTQAGAVTSNLDIINSQDIPLFRDILSGASASLISFINSLSGSSSTSSGSNTRNAIGTASLLNSPTGKEYLQNKVDYELAKSKGDTSAMNALNKANGAIRKEYGIGKDTINGSTAKKLLGYDNGGILSGLGGIKATKKNEIVFDSNISSKLLSPKKSKEFLNIAEALNKMLDNSSAFSAITSSIGKISSGQTSMTDSHDIYIDGNAIGKMSKTDYESISSIFRRYIPIT